MSSRMPRYRDPYQTSKTASRPASSKSNPLLIPAIILIVLSALTILSVLVNLLIIVISLVQDPESSLAGARLIGMIIASVVICGTNAAIILGGVCMIRLSGHDGAMLGSVVAMLPCCTSFGILGVPFGVWAFILVKQKKIERMFNDWD
jgi:hypothetical protein